MDTLFKAAALIILVGGGGGAYLLSIWGMKVVTLTDVRQFLRRRPASTTPKTSD
jgi:hypothetical protein